MPSVVIQRPRSYSGSAGPAPSSEQRTFIECRSNRISLQAPAGSGKTTTIKHRVDSIIGDGGTVALFTFDRANAQEAKNRIKHKNVQIQTFNSLAYQLIGAKHKERFVPDISAFDLANLIDWRNMRLSTPEQHVIAGLALKTYRLFCSSADNAIGLHHLPCDVEQLDEYYDPDSIIQLATSTFNNQLNNPNWPLTHDCALKAMQLSQYNLGVSEVIIDEAQDTSPVCFSFAKNQKNTSLSLVGDKHQSIYQFRGAVNAMALLDNATHIKLTKSHRFGAKIADTAERCLNLAKNDDFRLSGSKPSDQIFIYTKPDGEKADTLPRSHLKFVRQQALAGKSVLILCRSLQGIASASLAFMAENNNTMNDYVGFKLAGGVKRYNLSLLSDVGILGQGKKVDDPFLSSFRSFKELVAYSATAGDQELTSAIGFQDRYRAAASGIAKSIRGNNLETTLRRENGGRLPHHSKIPAHVTISSAHRSKGLEADIVVVWDDYKTWSSLIDGYKDFQTDEATRSEFEQEINLVYVAVTRAKNTLFLPSKLAPIVNQNHVSNILPE